MYPIIRTSFSKLVFATLIVLAGASLPVQASDVVTVKIQNLTDSMQSEVPVTFGQVFRPGDIPAGADIVARRIPDGASIPLQVDKKAAHNDRSLRHAVLTARLPGLDASEILAVKLSASAQGTPGPAVQLTDLLASTFSAQVALRLKLNGKTYSANARRFLQRAGVTEQWLSGPLVSEWIVGGPVTDVSGNPHPHLAAYFHVRAYKGLGRVRVDVVIENGWTFVPNPTAVAYDATIKVGNATKYTRTIRHYHHTRWHKSFWWGSAPEVYVEHDNDYLQASGAVPKYPDLSPSEIYLNGMRQESVPMAHGDLTQYFPSTGAQDQIGPLPRWTAAYAVSADRRAFNSMLANDDHAGSYSVHYRDKNIGLPVSIADHPELTLQADGQLPPSSGGNPNTEDQAHQPSIGFVSYLVTGDYFYLEEMQFWTSWNHLWANAAGEWAYRQGSKGIFGVQVRGQAWSLRNLGQAAYAIPDDHPYKALLVASVRHNIEHNESLYSSNPSANKLGALRAYDGYDQFAPWMDDFYTWTMGYLVDLGFDAVQMRNWKAKFPVGRMGVNDYCYIHAAAYHLTVGENNDHWWPDFGTLYEKNFGPIGDCPLGEEMEGYPSEPTGFTSNLRPALAVAVDAGVPGAAAAWKRFMNTKRQPDYSDYPNWAVMPRDRSVGPVDEGPIDAPVGDGGESGTGGSGSTGPLSLVWLVLAALIVTVRRRT